MQLHGLVLALRECYSRTPPYVHFNFSTKSVYCRYAWTVNISTNHWCKIHIPEHDVFLLVSAFRCSSHWVKYSSPVGMSSASHYDAHERHQRFETCRLSTRSSCGSFLSFHLHSDPVEYIGRNKQREKLNIPFVLSYQQIDGSLPQNESSKRKMDTFSSCMCNVNY